MESTTARTAELYQLWKASCNALRQLRADKQVLAKKQCVLSQELIALRSRSKAEQELLRVRTAELRQSIDNHTASYQQHIRTHRRLCRTIEATLGSGTIGTWVSTLLVLTAPQPEPEPSPAEQQMKPIVLSKSPDSNYGRSGGLYWDGYA